MRRTFRRATLIFLASAASLVAFLSLGVDQGEGVIEPIYTLPYRDPASLSCGFHCYFDEETGWHDGVDYVIGVASAGEDVAAAAGGVAKPCGFSLSAGNYIAVSHGNGHITCYLHLLDPALPLANAIVGRGEVIGFEGSTGYSTGPHLHFETRVDATTFTCGFDGTPVDPYGIVTPGTYLWTTDPPSYADVCGTPGSVADGSLYRGKTEGTVYRTFDNTKYPFASANDFESMGTAFGFWWYDIICVPDGYMNGVADIPPDKTLLREYPTTAVHVYLRSGCNARFFIPDPTALNQMIVNGHANAPVRDVPPGQASDLNPIPNAGCHVREHSGTGQYLFCAPFGVPAKWAIYHPYVLARLGLSDSTIRVLWDGAMSGYPDLANLHAQCPNSDTDLGSTPWSDLAEKYYGTNSVDSCANTPASNDEGPPDAWPPDFDDNQRALLADVLALNPYFNLSVASNPNVYARYDLLIKSPGIINLSDVLLWSTVNGVDCDP